MADPSDSYHYCTGVLVDEGRRVGFSFPAIMSDIPRSEAQQVIDALTGKSMLCGNCRITTKQVPIGMRFIATSTTGQTLWCQNWECLNCGTKLSYLA